MQSMQFSSYMMEEKSLTIVRRYFQRLAQRNNEQAIEFEERFDSFVRTHKWELRRDMVFEFKIRLKELEKFESEVECCETVKSMAKKALLWCEGKTRALVAVSVVRLLSRAGL